MKHFRNEASLETQRPQVTGKLSHRWSQGAAPFFVVQSLVAHEVLKHVAHSTPSISIMKNVSWTKLCY